MVFWASLQKSVPPQRLPSIELLSTDNEPNRLQTIIPSHLTTLTLHPFPATLSRMKSGVRTRGSTRTKGPFRQRPLWDRPGKRVQPGPEVELWTSFTICRTAEKAKERGEGGRNGAPTTTPFSPGFSSSLPRESEREKVYERLLEGVKYSNPALPTHPPFWEQPLLPPPTRSWRGD